MPNPRLPGASDWELCAARPRRSPLTTASTIGRMRSNLLARSVLGSLLATKVSLVGWRFGHSMPSPSQASGGLGLGAGRDYTAQAAPLVLMPSCIKDLQAMAW